MRAAAGDERVLEGRLVLPAGTAVPVAEGTDAERGEDWARPVERSGPSSPVFVYSLLLATFLGTMGLPHILVRFYTNPDGPRRGGRPCGCWACWGCSTCSPPSTRRWAER